MRCWFGLRVGSGAEGFNFRFASRPPRVDVYCQARIVVGVAIGSLGFGGLVECAGGMGVMSRTTELAYGCTYIGA